jgi:hypothetical protein
MKKVCQRQEGGFLAGKEVSGLAKTRYAEAEKQPHETMSAAE